MALVPLGQPSPATSPAVVVYNKDGKPHVVVDLCRVNLKSYVDVYPLPRQDTVLQDLSGSTIFSALDMTKKELNQTLGYRGIHREPSFRFAVILRCVSHSSRWI